MAVWGIMIKFNQKIVCEMELPDDISANEFKHILIEKGYLNNEDFLGEREVAFRTNQKDGCITLRGTSGYPYATLKKKDTQTLGDVAAQPIITVPRCPTCGSTNIQKVNISGRAIGGLLFGRLSAEGRAQFYGKDCRYQW